MRVFRLFSEGYIDEETEFEYKQITTQREVFPLLHDHDYFEFFLVIRGSVKHFINNRESRLERGHLMFIRPTDFHSYKPVGQDFHLLNLAVLEKTIGELFNFLGKGLNKKELLESTSPPKILLTETELNRVISRFDRLNTLMVNDKKGLNTELRLILVNLFSSYFIPGRRPVQNLPEWLELAVNELQKQENFRKGMDKIREIACKSDEHICRSFKKHLKKTPTEFLNEIKLNFAANQIRFSGKKICDIAYEAGFENLSHFHRRFRSAFHYSPGEFRKHHYKDIVMEKGGITK